MSTTNKYSILPATPTDLLTISSFVHTSKQPLIINRVLWKDWPNETLQKNLYAKAVKGGFEDPLSETWKVVEEASGEIVGHLVLGRKKPVAKEATVDQEKGGSRGGDGGIPEGLVAEVAIAVGEAVQEIGKNLEGVEHFEVTHIFISLPHRKKGLGTQLINLCISKAKAEKLPLAVAAEPQVYKFFLKLGFEDTKHVDFDLSKWGEAEYCGFGLFRLWGMVMRFEMDVGG